MEIEKLKALATKNNVVRAVCQLLAGRERPVPTNDLRRIRYELRDDFELNITPAEAVEVFKEFQRLGAGILKFSRKPNDPPRFKWSVNSIEFGRQALGVKRKENGTEAAPVSTGKRRRAPDGFIVLNYPMRGEFIELHIPRDITKDEAEGLAAFIAKLGT